MKMLLGRAGPPVQDLWLFADCSGERFATSMNPDRSDAWEQSVFHEEGTGRALPSFRPMRATPLCDGRSYVLLKQSMDSSKYERYFVDSVNFLIVSSN